MPPVINNRGELLDYLKHRRPLTDCNQSLGMLLLESGDISLEQLQQALTHQHSHPSRARLGQTLIELGMLSRERLSQTLAEQLGIPHISLEQFDLDPACTRLLPESLARHYQVVSLLLDGERLVVATTDPTDQDLQHLLGFATGKTIELVQARASEIEQAINRTFANSTVEDLPENETGEVPLSVDEMKLLAEDRPTVRFVDNLLEEAISRRASDIHLRPGEHDVSVLLRVDGRLQELRRIKRGHLSAIVSRIKIIGGMNIAEHRLPQDGRHMVRTAERSIDLRLSIMPTVHGESVVIRVLDTSQSLKGLDQIGFNAQDVARFRNLISHNQGIILVTGPTGSGKSTTLYAALNSIKATGVNIITVEDPVEYQIDGIRQIQVKPQIGYTFARALRHILRHDPDVIMVGEVRDQETALMATESALTGHLVLSTLHTNSAATTVTRLLEIGIAPYLLNASLLGVLAQRLVRRNCPHCLKQELVPGHVRQALGLTADERFYVGSGCSRCHGSGVVGRVAAYELLEVTPALRVLIEPSVSAQKIEQQAIADGMRPLTQSALQLARETTVSLAEVYRVRLE
ncbi:GspE/PulE family protein [Pseudomonas sp. N040]|uniref:GspE/PulE family protein n=1 Tax=Pseudomonas sp. N040 TaxID=2785325 RepID=UPI0018A27A5C|nr:GspE/PulE family protein [Pseudomonas sp. N040]MBF7729308.1 type II/IV secretion system protein [Pseudomonas sp. N040]MBW7012948.1 GspE/PulE family protein [Pseudomonas sp. N040]